MPELGYLDGPAVRAAATVSQCADALTAALQQPFTGDDPPRLAIPTRHGELLVMPSGKTGFPTTKLVTVAHPDVPGPRIKGVHIVFDPATLAPVAVLDAEVLTLVRTAAVSITALRQLADPASARLVVCGTGPQAYEHATAICAEWPIRHLCMLSRDSRRGVDAAAAMESRTSGVECISSTLAAHGQVLRDADIIVCATSTTEALFTDDPGIAGAVVAVGSHRPVERELPANLLARSFICVEDRGSALREAGDIIRAISDGAITESSIAADLGELVRSEVAPDMSRPRVFKSVGMGWEDAIVGARIAGLDARGDS